MATKKMLAPQTPPTQAGALARVESNPGAGYWFDLPVEVAAEVAPLADPIFQKTAYAQFLSQKSSHFGTIKTFIPDLLDGDPVLLLPQPYPPRKLSPFCYYVVHSFQHWSKTDAQNKILATSLDGEAMRELGSRSKSRKAVDPVDGKEWVEHIETVLFILEGEDGLIPARCTFKATKTEAARIADTTARLIEENPAIWEKLSEAHANSMTAMDPRFMFYIRCELKRGTGKASGFAYTAASGRAIPSNVKQRSMILSAASDEKFRTNYEEVKRVWIDRVEAIKSQVVK